MRLKDIEIGEHYELRSSRGIGPRVEVVRVGEYTSTSVDLHWPTAKKGVLVRHDHVRRDEWVAPQQIVSVWSETQDEAIATRKAHKERMREIITSLNEALALLGGDDPDWLADNPYRNPISAYSGSINRHLGERVTIHGSLTPEQAETLRDRLFALHQGDDRD